MDVTLLAAALLLVAQVLIGSVVLGQVEDGVVVAAVVGDARRRRVGKGGGRDGVAAPQLDRVHADPGSEDVDGPLDSGGRLWPAGAAVCSDRCSIGDDRAG